MRLEWKFSPIEVRGKTDRNHSLTGLRTKKEREELWSYQFG